MANEHPGNQKFIDGIPLTPKNLIDPIEKPQLSIEEERLELKQKLAGAFRIFGRLGFGEGTAGHISARDPEFSDHFWVNPFARSFRLMRVSDLILVNHDGEVVYGDRHVNRPAFCIHAAIHRARPEVVSVAHAHTVHGKAWASLGRQLDPITQDSCCFYEDHVVIPDQGGAVVVEPSAGNEIAARFLQGKAAIHQNHGIFTVGETVDAAAYWFLLAERCCMTQIMAESVGIPKLIPHTMATHTRNLTATAIGGWVKFQPLWQDICHSDPSLFD